LWNHVEAFEKHQRALLAREFNIALPHELTLEQQRYALQDWVRENFTRKGLIADVAIHAPGKGGDERNTHAHVMVVMRKLDGSEFVRSKERFATYGEKDAARKAELESLRESWERIGNRHLERHGHGPTLDRRTLLAQGSARPATIHQGKDATAMERRGVGTDLGDHNRAVALNEAQVIDLAAARARREHEAAGAKTAAMSDSLTPANGNAADEQRRQETLRQEETQRREAADKTEALRRETIQKQQDEAALRAAEANAQRQVEQAREMRALHDQALLRQAYVDGLEKQAEQARQVKDWTEKREREEAARPQDRPIFVNDAGARYGQALGANYDVRDPYV